MGKTAADIPPYLELFCTGAVGAATVADFLLVHNGVLAGVEASSGACGEAPNVKFINLGSTQAFTQLLVDKLLDQVEEADRKIPSRQFVPFLAKHTSLFPYALVEYKPAYGHIFGDYIEDYSHWAYSDLDVLWGDLGRHLTTSDWTDFDLITWGTCCFMTTDQGVYHLPALVFSDTHPFNLLRNRFWRPKTSLFEGTVYHASERPRHDQSTLAGLRLPKSCR
jgi:hypothetical protein